MKDYMLHNQQTYNILAQEFKTKENIWTSEREIVRNILNLIQKTEVLELGPGNGKLAQLLIKRGYTVTALEFSENMAKIAKETAPKLKIIIDEFLNHDFKNKKYNLIIGIDFIHLFTEEDSIKVLNKMSNLVNKKGLIYLSTITYPKSEEGYFGYNSQFSANVTRYRRKFTEQELISLISKYFIIKQKLCRKEGEKYWLDLILKLNS